MSEPQKITLLTDATKLYDRAALSAGEYRKTLTTLSSGSLGVFFLAVTTKVEPLLSAFQRKALMVAIFGMALSILLGITAWAADARWAFSSAAAIDPTKVSEAAKWERQWNRWHVVKRNCDYFLPLTFMTGVIAAVCYVWSRAQG